MSWSSRLQHRPSIWSINTSYVLAAVLVTGGLLSIHRLVTHQGFSKATDLYSDVLQQWHVVNAYHVFPTMTTRQIELKIEGSIDGVDWKQYEFEYRPNLLSTRPSIVLPHHPRLDWMMWFVPFHPRFLPWFDSFLIALLENSADVTAMLKHNPFKDQAPNFVRVNSWHYEFTSPEERELTGNWWKRTYLGPFTPLPGKFKITRP